MTDDVVERYPAGARHNENRLKLGTFALAANIQEFFGVRCGTVDPAQVGGH